MQNKGWTVTLAGIGINLALGVLYTWSVIKKAIPSEWGWSDSDKALPCSNDAYLIAAVVLVLAAALTFVTRTVEKNHKERFSLC